MRIINIADPENSFEEGFLDTPGEAGGVALFGEFAFVADGHEGLRIINVSDSENPEEVGYYNTPGYADGVVISDDGLIYVGDCISVGIYRFTDPNEIDDLIISMPIEFSLFPAYPNPFNSTTTITYALPTPGNVSLQVYNPIGQRITTLFEGHRQAGTYSTDLIANNLSSGLYFVRLEAVGQFSQQKLLLIR